MAESAISVPCPKCSAVPGMRCTNKIYRSLNVFHAERWRETRSVETLKSGEALVSETLQAPKSTGQSVQSLYEYAHSDQIFNRR
jgi:hypothetical protein